MIRTEAQAEFEAYIRKWLENPAAHGGLEWLQDNGHDALQALIEEIDRLRESEVGT